MKKYNEATLPASQVFEPLGSHQVDWCDAQSESNLAQDTLESHSRDINRRRTLSGDRRVHDAELAHEMAIKENNLRMISYVNENIDNALLAARRLLAKVEGERATPKGKLLSFAYGVAAGAVIAITVFMVML